MNFENRSLGANISPLLYTLLKKLIELSLRKEMSSKYVYAA